MIGVIKRDTRSLDYGSYSVHIRVSINKEWIGFMQGLLRKLGTGDSRKSCPTRSTSGSSKWTSTKSTGRIRLAVCLSADPEI